MGHVVVMTDQLVSEYLSFRGFTTTAGSFDAESSNPKDGKLSVGPLLENIVAGG